LLYFEKLLRICLLIITIRAMSAITFAAITPF
jgi:hypothetical protein